MKQNWTMYIYKADKRTKSGERLVSTTVWTGRDYYGMQREVVQLHWELYPHSQFRIEFHPIMQTIQDSTKGITA